ncbi:MAG: HAD family hydrolase, partial [Nanopusillaceae archaeon]
REFIKRKFNIDIGDGVKLDNSGAPMEELVRSLIEKYKLNVDVGELLKEYEEFFINSGYINKIKFTMGAKEILNYFKDKKYKLGLVTSNTRRVTTEILKKLGIFGLFEAIITREDIKNPKPDPDPYIMVLKLINLSPLEVIAIEDSVYGIISAKRAGLNAIGVASGVNKKRELMNAGASMVFKNLKELYDYLIKQDKNNNQ